MDLAPTASNMKAAQRTLEEIQRKIASGTFEYADYFPDSPNAGRTGSTFKDIAQRWMDTQTGARSTVASYQTAVNYWNGHLGSKQLRDLVLSDLKAAVAQLTKTASGKTANNYMVALRGVFELAVGDRLIPAERNPALGLKNQSHQTPEPDPLDLDEMNAVLDYMASRYPPEAHSWFEFAFCTGMRPSEILTLTWGHVDWRRRKVKVEGAEVLGQEKATKTNRIRHVDLSERALAALSRQKAVTFMKGSGARIFTNPNTGEPWSGSQVQRRLYWNPALRACGMRQRDQYQTRHTYATLNLMGSVNIAYLAKQLGHSKVTTTLNVYARWLEDADKGREAAKLDGIFSANYPNSVPPKTENGEI
jgi:integrase